MRIVMVMINLTIMLYCCICHQLFYTHQRYEFWENEVAVAAVLLFPTPTCCSFAGQGNSTDRSSPANVRSA